MSYGYDLFSEQVNHIAAVLAALNELDKNPAIDADEHHFIKVQLVENDKDERVVGEFRNELGPGSWVFSIKDAP